MGCPIDIDFELLIGQLFPYIHDVPRDNIKKTALI